MSSSRRVLVFDDRSSLVAGIADKFVILMTELLVSQSQVNVVLTGGTVGIDVLATVSNTSRNLTIDWQSVHFWWGDERWLPAGDADRNDTQADDALLSRIHCPTANIHRFPSADGVRTLDSAALEYAAELQRHAPLNAQYPPFDLVFLGVGPDAHIASLFPGHEEIKERTRTVVPVRNSPKPPPERLSLTLPVINSAQHIWLCLSGADKAAALGLALAGANTADVPAAGALGLRETLYLVDQAAAADVPQDLLASS